MNKKTLVIGATPNAERYAYKATVMLKQFGHNVTAYGIKKGNIENTEIINIWPESEEFDTVTLYINPTLQEKFYKQIIDLKPKRVIFNPGTENIIFASMLADNNIQPVEACTLVMLFTKQY